MDGRYLDIGGRRTYFPPFANEVFGNRPYWSCTFTSLLNGANVGWLGQWPATPAEIRALAKASGDVDTRGGSRSSHMLTAMRVRYGRTMALESLTPDWVKRRLSTGWAMVAGVTYGALPEEHRKPSPLFKDGHRVVLVGWEGDRTRILDPMERHGPGFTGRWIRWSDFEPAWWSAEQLWFQEGMFLRPPEVRSIATFHPARAWSVKAGRKVIGRSFDDPRVIVKQVRPGRDSRAEFDAHVVVIPKRDGAEPIGRFIHVTSGALKGLLIDPTAAGITADTRLGTSAAAGGGAGSGTSPAGTLTSRSGRPADPIEAAKREATRAEYDRVEQAFRATGKLPERPG